MKSDSAVPFSLRPIESSDDPAVAAIIRAVMPEFGAIGCGFAISDPEVDAMAAAYEGPRHGYWVVQDAFGLVVGGGGFAPLEGGAPHVCELRKMYFRREARGHGVGRALLLEALAGARRAGFRQCYLETLEAMERARALYERNGFQRLAAPLGSTGHHGCNAWYILDL